MYSYVSNRKTINHIQNLDDFFNSRKTLKGFHRYDGSYVVQSYSTVIAEYVDGVWYINDTNYSQTTRCHQGFVYRALSFIELNDRSIHLYHVPMYATSLIQYVTGTVARSRAERIKAGL